MHMQDIFTLFSGSGLQLMKCQDLPKMQNATLTSQVKKQRKAGKREKVCIFTIIINLM